MSVEETEQDPYDKRNLSTIARWKILSMGLMLPLIIPTMPTQVEASAFKAGATDDPTVPINCSNAVMTTAPKFLSTPKGSAKYPFSMKCTSPRTREKRPFAWLPGGGRSTGTLQSYVTAARDQMKDDGGIS